MEPRRRTKSTVALLVAALALGLAPTVVLGAVSVYKNNFSSKAEGKELRHSSGKHCDKRWREKAKRVRARRNRGGGTCGYRPPVEGDTDGPNHDFQAKQTLLKTTPKGLRKSTYVTVAVRSGKNSGYELRVFPRRHRFELRRSPSGGGGGFPAQGRSRAIKGVGEPNLLRLKAVGNRVTATVNGRQLAEVTDSSPGQVGGRKLEVGVGSTRRSDKRIVATFDNLKLQVPNP
ncbi:MAG: hypothetical protein AABM66_11170 [Actinomycetota bacterium]